MKKKMENEEVKRNHISEFSVALLSHVLSFIALSDVKAVSLVCKKWHRAFQMPTFWMIHIARRLKLHLKSRKWLLGFDNFFLGLEESYYTRYKAVPRKVHLL